MGRRKAESLPNSTKKTLLQYPVLYDVSLTFDILGWYTPATIYFSQDVSLCMATPIIVILLHCQWFMCKLDFTCSSLSILLI